MKTLIPAAIRCSLMFTAVTAPLFCVRPVQAYTVTLKQIGSNVVANGSGAFNLTGLTLSGGATLRFAFITPAVGMISTGPRGFNSLDLYTGFTGPSSFGRGSTTLADFGSGNFVFIS